jgi:hypothetical protein
MSLQFHSRPGYFSHWLIWVGLAVLAGCDERERLTFPAEDPGDGVGPFTTIVRPEVADTTVTEGDVFILAGYSLDPDGIDTVYLDVSGAGQSYAPLLGGGVDSVPFALQFSTFGKAGSIITVQIYAVDVVGDRGPASDRSIRIE